jgi:hypothetical protein
MENKANKICDNTNQTIENNILNHLTKSFFFILMIKIENKKIQFSYNMNFSDTF